MNDIIGLNKTYTFSDFYHISYKDMIRIGRTINMQEESFFYKYAMILGKDNLSVVFSKENEVTDRLMYGAALLIDYAREMLRRLKRDLTEINLESKPSEILLGKANVTIYGDEKIFRDKGERSYQYTPENIRDIMNENIEKVREQFSNWYTLDCTEIIRLPKNIKNISQDYNDITIFRYNPYDMDIYQAITIERDNIKFFNELIRKVNETYKGAERKVIIDVIGDILGAIKIVKLLTVGLSCVLDPNISDELNLKQPNNKQNIVAIIIIELEDRIVDYIKNN